MTMHWMQVLLSYLDSVLDWFFAGKAANWHFKIANGNLGNIGLELAFDSKFWNFRISKASKDFRRQISNFSKGSRDVLFTVAST